MHRFLHTGFYHKNRLRNYALVSTKDPREFTIFDIVGASKEWKRRQRKIVKRARRIRRSLSNIQSVDILMLNAEFWRNEFMLHSDPGIQRDVNRGLMTKLEGKFHFIWADIAEFYLNLASEYAPKFSTNN